MILHRVGLPRHCLCWRWRRPPAEELQLQGHTWSWHAFLQRLPCWQPLQHRQRHAVPAPPWKTVETGKTCMTREMICHRLHGLESLLLAQQEPPWPNGQGVGPLIQRLWARSSPTGAVVVASYTFVQEVQRSRAMPVRQTSVCGGIKACIQAWKSLHAKQWAPHLKSICVMSRPFTFQTLFPGPLSSSEAPFCQESKALVQARVVGLETHKHRRVHSSVVRAADCGSAGPCQVRACPSLWKRWRTQLEAGHRNRSSPSRWKRPSSSPGALSNLQLAPGHSQKKKPPKVRRRCTQSKQSVSSTKKLWQWCRRQRVPQPNDPVSGISGQSDQTLGQVEVPLTSGGADIVLAAVARFSCSRSDRALALCIA